MLREGKRAALSAREFALLHALLERPGGILSREQLEERMYGWDGTVTSNVVEVIIHGLRKRFGNDIIRNVRGLGWRVVKDET
jgi:two-component system OmpR family response regulator/two-component system response regulator QseB